MQKKTCRNQNAKIGKSYMIYGKIKGMSQFRPLGGDRFVINRIYASIFFVKNREVKEKLERELEFLNKQGEFQLRVI